jgi:predicted TIM-barrel fold metal-dependent hydrolase
MERRTFLEITGGATLSGAIAEAAAIPIIDTHIHLFDPGRPQGVPWPPKDNVVLYHPALPDRYRKIATPLGIVGAVEVEASPWLEDNQWVLDVAAKDNIIVGMVGDLEPDKPDFRKQLDRFHSNPLYRGIRYGNLWGRSLHDSLAKPEFIAGVKALAQADLEMDSANPDPALLKDILRLTDRVPELRIVIDHVPRMDHPTEAAALRAMVADLRELGKRRQVYIKVSGVLRRVNGKVPEDPAFYRDRLDQLWGIFGEDRLVYGSDWPNSDQWGEYPKGLRVVREYFTSKGQTAAEKYFWKNSVAAYKWVKRDKSQPG